MSKDMFYTVVMPVYCESGSLIEVTERISKVFTSIGKGDNFEIIFVDDGSTDSSRQAIKGLCKEKGYVRGVLFRRNIGKAFALSTGFLNARGDFIITMDADLQDRPEDIPNLIDKINEGYDLVSGWKKQRQDNIIRVLGSRIFNWAVSCFSGLKLHDFNCGFKIYKSNVIKNMYIYGQHHRFTPLLAFFMGFKVTEIPVSHDRRKYGVSKYPVFRYQGLFDFLSILFIYKYRFSPLYFFGIFGLLLIVPSAAVIFVLVGGHILYLLGFGEQFILRNRPLIAIASTFFLMGIQVFLTGFVCDFILYHAGTRMTEEITKSSVEEVL